MRSLRRVGPSARLYVAVGAVATVLLLASAPRLLVGEVAQPADILYQHAPFDEHRPAGWEGPRNNALFDAAVQTAPLDALVRQAFLDRRLPAWNPHQGGGNVLMADGLSAPFDLPRLASQLVPSALAPGLILWLKMLIGSLGMAALLHHGLRLGRWPSLLGATVFAASGPVLGQLELPRSPGVWTPLLVLGALVAVRRADGRGALALALPTAAVLLAGHPGTAFAALAIALLAAVWAERTARGLLTVLAGVALGVAISAPYLVPHVIFTAASHQSAERAATSAPWFDWPQARYWAVRPLTLVSPAALTSGPVLSGWRRLGLGSYPEATLALGTGSLTLAWVALRSRWDDRRVRGAAALALGGVLISSRVPVVSGLLGLPVARILNPNQFGLAFALGGAVLVAIGAEALLRTDERALALARRTALVLAAVVSAAYLALVVSWAPAIDALTRYADLSAGYTDDPIGLLQRARASFAPLMVVQAVGFWLLVVILRRAPRPRPAFVLGALVLEAGALWWTYNPTTPRHEVRPDIPELAAARELVGSSRIAGLGARDLEPNSATLYGLRDINVYGNVSQDASHLNERLGFTHASFFHLDGRAGDTPAALDALAVEIVLAGRGVRPLPGLELVRDGAVRLYRNPGAVPRAYLVGEVAVVPEIADAVERLADPTFDVQGSALLDRAPAVPPSDGDGDASIVVDDPEHLVIETAADGPRVLVLADTAAPGWSVAVDGEPAEAMTANGRVRAVALTAGAHTVVWRYRPPGLTVGLWLGAAGLLVAAALARRRRTTG